MGYKLVMIQNWIAKDPAKFSVIKITEKIYIKNLGIVLLLFKMDKGKSYNINDNVDANSSVRAC